MKKSILLKSLLICSFGLFLNHQSKSQDLDFGLRLGMQWANVSGFDSISPNSKFNFTFSFYTMFDAGPVVINPELLFEGRGFKYADEASGWELKQKIGYLTIPVFVNYYFVNDQLFIQAGPYASFLLNSDLNLTGFAGFTPDSDNKSSFNGFDYGLAFGAGFNVGRVDLGVRYMLGLSDISADGAGVTYPGTDIKHRVLNFHVGVKILNNRAGN